MSLVVVDQSMEDLPVPLMVDILSRLPVKKIVQCKCVCKKWLEIVLDSYFADIQLSRSPACFMIIKLDNYTQLGNLKWVEVKDELDHHNLLHDRPVMSLDLNLAPIFQETQRLPVGSVDGLLCLPEFLQEKINTYICNPITREYMILPSQQYYRKDHSMLVFYCFGVCSLTREYKVIQIFQNLTKPNFTSLSEVCVYTLGTCQWRSLGHAPYRFKEGNGIFFNGHAHWLLRYRNNLPEKICAFDFDKETFELFPSPPYEDAIAIESLLVLNGCLCRCDSYDSSLTVWVMKEYGIKKSWHKELVINYTTIPHHLNRLGLKPCYPIQSYKDGTFLMTCYGGQRIIYCPQRKTIEKTDIYDSYVYFNELVYRPSFQRLRNFENEKVYVF